MRFRGCVYKNGRHWLAEIPSLAYEQGKVAPTVEKLCQLLRAVNPDEDLVIA